MNRADRNLQIKEQLLNTNKTLAEIGEQFGITREYVRQIAKSFGVDCSERVLNRTKTRTSERIHEVRRLQPLFNEAWSICVSLGFDVQPIIRNATEVCTTVLLINGIICAVGKLSKGRDRCLQLHGTDRSVWVRPSIVISKSAIDGEWWVFPMNVAEKNTSFASERLDRNSRYYSETNFQQYKAAWHLLEAACRRELGELPPDEEEEAA